MMSPLKMSGRLQGNPCISPLRKKFKTDEVVEVEIPEGWEAAGSPDKSLDADTLRRAGGRDESLTL